MPAAGHLRRAVAVTAAAAGLLGLSGCDTLGRSELRRGVESLSSMAGEGVLLANGVAQNRSKVTYTRVQAGTVAGDAQHEAEKLADATPQAGFAGRRNRAVALATEISGLLGDLQTSPGDEATGRRVARGLQAAQNQADALVGRL